jgi:hypothetical protein
MPSPTAEPHAPHPTAELDRLAAGEASPDDRRRAILHLLHGCESCRRRLAAVLQPEPDAAEVRAAVDRVIAQASDLQRGFASDLEDAARLAGELCDLDAPEQRRRLADLPARTLRALCLELFEQGRAQRFVCVAETLRLAELALAAASVLERRGDGELAAQAWAELGNARRIAGDLAGAEDALATAAERAEEVGADPLFRAEVLAYRGSLANWQRRFDEAERLLEQAAKRYALYGSRTGVVEVLVRLAQVEGFRGEPRRGVPAVAAALALLDRPGDEALRIIAIHTLIYLVAESGEAAEAAALIARAQPLFATVSAPLPRLHYEWLCARVARDVGRDEEAAAQLADLNRKFLAQGLQYEAACVALDLAALLARHGRRRELAELTAACAEVFTVLGVGREHLASLAVVAQAEAAEAAERIAVLSTVLQGLPSARNPTAGPRV